MMVPEVVAQLPGLRARSAMGRMSHERGSTSPAPGFASGRPREPAWGERFRHRYLARSTRPTVSAGAGAAAGLAAAVAVAPARQTQHSSIRGMSPHPSADRCTIRSARTKISPLAVNGFTRRRNAPLPHR